jgi:hypothetical protein
MRIIGVLAAALLLAGVGWLRWVLRDQHGHAVHHD